MSFTKRLGASLLFLVLLVPAISSHDDALRLSAFVANASHTDDCIAGMRNRPESDYDPTLAAFPDLLETLQVGSVCSLHVEVFSLPVHRSESAGESNRSVAAPVGRAPPLV
jgi:hypothetical protein